MMYTKTKAKSIIVEPDRLQEVVSKALNDMATLVGTTLGPGGRGVLIERDGMAPLVTKDGATVAKHIGVADASANTIIEAAKEICANTAKEAGDGTTTAIVLANAVVKGGHSFLTANPKYNPQRMVRELQTAYDTVVVPYLRDCAIAVKDEQQLRHIAMISANGDEKIADAVVRAVMAAGDDGTVLVNESQGGSIAVENADGYIVITGLKDLGQIGPAFINDKANQQVKMDKGYVVLYDGSINDLRVPGLIQDAVSDDGGFADGAPIIVFAHSFAENVLDKFAKTTKGGLTVIPIKTPRSGLPNGASMFLDDMAAYTGATVFNPGTVEDLDEDGLGEFDSARVNMYESFISATPEPGRIDARIGELKSIMDAAFSEFDRSHIRAAIAKLTGGVSTIHVGGVSDLEIREKKARVEDAIEAVRSAIAEGIVPGGGVCHLVLHDLLKDRAFPSWQILQDALMAPFVLLLSNCGESEREVLPLIQPLIVEAARSHALPMTAFDCNSHSLVDPLKVGLIEPAKVIRVSIANALSVASLLITLGGIVVVPRDAGLETQLDLANQAFSSMMESAKDVD